MDLGEYLVANPNCAELLQPGEGALHYSAIYPQAAATIPLRAIGPAARPPRFSSHRNEGISRWDQLGQIVLGGGNGSVSFPQFVIQHEIGYLHTSFSKALHMVSQHNLGEYLLIVSEAPSTAPLKLAGSSSRTICAGGE